MMTKPIETVGDLIKLLADESSESRIILNTDRNELVIMHPQVTYRISETVEFRYRDHE